jgi:hypothetical protein
MCEDNRAYLSACETKEDAIRLYKQTIDWALEESYPDIDFLRKEFCDQESQGLFVDHHFDGEVLNEHQVYVFHHCTGTIRVGLNIAKKLIPMCYFANDCDITILGIDDERILPDRVPLYVFGKNKIVAESTHLVEFRKFVNLDIKKGATDE